jgi:hypothetical protein
VTRKRLNRKGQFSLIAALLVAVVLVTALITTYSLVRNSPFEKPPQVLGAVDEMNLNIKRVLEFTVGYYGSILQVTGNMTYAKSVAGNYLYSGLLYVVRTHPEWSPSFTFNYSDTSTNWFKPTSRSVGNLSIAYSLSGLGISNIHYSTSCELNVAIVSTNATQTRISVTKEENLPQLALTQSNFNFYSYNYIASSWTTVNPNSIMVFSNGTYVMNIPSGVDATSYMVRVVDPRGVMTTASRVSYYSYTLTWNNSLYSSLNNDVMVVEALQNGSLRWLGQNLKLTTQGRPIPPLPVKAFRINQTINGLNRQVPFQVEDWGSNYRVPLGLSTNASVFSNKNMLVFLLTQNQMNNVTNFRIWWDGRDSAVQTSYATTNRYFQQDNWQNGTLRNGKLTLRISGSFVINSTVGTSSVSAQFMRVNSQGANYGSGQSYVIHHGIVRDIVQQEAEWTNGITNSPNLYSQLVVMLPANATYYTYALRTIFINSSQSRTVSDLSIIRLSMLCAKTKWGSGYGQTLAENGTNAGFPTTVIIANMTQPFYNFSSTQTGWMHHWSEYIKNNNGGGIMFTNTSNVKLYTFDKIAAAKTGALDVSDSTQSTNKNVVIGVNPVERFSASFQYPLDVTWYGAVANFDGTDPIYRSSDQRGLWVIVENPPIISIS